ncbi:MAG: FIST signal transduction protein [Myxococcota bacterium]
MQRDRGLRVATSWTTDIHPARGAADAHERLLQRLGADPSYLVVFATEPFGLRPALQRLRELAGCPMHGATSFRAVMTEEGVHAHDGRALGMLGVVDPDGSYGVGMARIGDNPGDSAKRAAREALDQAQRPGEVPAAILMTAAPGCEEALIAGAESFFGSEVPIVGGSSADEQIQGDWLQAANERVASDSVVLSAMFPSTEVGAAFHSGHGPTSFRGRVTRSSGRTLWEIDGRPAAEVYAQWTGKALPAEDGASIFGDTTTVPLGRAVAAMGGIETFLLMHPATVVAGGGLTMFAEVREGDTVVLMRGTRRSLVTRAGRVAQSVADQAEERLEQVRGALVFFCAGCLLTVGEALDEAVAGVRSSLDGQPFLGAFTYGEQGCLPDGKNHHGNLMISIAGWL